MAFKTLDQLRTVTPGLNSELGLTNDGDNTWGDTNARNGFIQSAIAKLWPTMGRTLRETITTVANTTEYDLTSAIVDVELIDVMDLNTASLVATRIKSWRQILDEAADPIVVRLFLPTIQSGTTLKVTGYAPYVIPANGAASCDIPPRIEHVVRAGARVEAYRAKLNQFANFQTLANENRANAITAADVLELLRQAKREFEEGVSKNARNLTAAHRAMSQLG